MPAIIPPKSTLPAPTSPGPLRIDTENPRYFADAAGNAVYLTGSHTWANFQDVGGSNPPPVFDYMAYLDFLQAHHHNFFRLWTWEQTKGAPWSANGEIWFAPSVYIRTGPDNALDGGPRFDLTQFNQAYFDRLRSRVLDARERGIYVSIMLFDGWSVGKKLPSDPGNPWTGHPYHASNNINNVDGDTNHDGNGYETQDLSIPGVTARQEAYVQKLIDTVNDLDNVLYEICNECNQDSKAWQYHLIDFIHAYEKTKPKQHPVGMSAIYPDGNNTDLFNGPADWIAPNATGGYKDEPPSADGSKVVLVDTDHLWGEGGDRAWVWKSFTRGYNVIYMDCYVQIYCETYPPSDPTRLSLISNLGYTQDYANQMDLIAMLPRPHLCSTGYCLVSLSADQAEFIVYVPQGGLVTVDLRDVKGTMRADWLNPKTGTISQVQGTISSGRDHSFIVPFLGDAVLRIRQVNPEATSLLH